MQSFSHEKTDSPKTPHAGNNAAKASDTSSVQASLILKRALGNEGLLRTFESSDSGSNTSSGSGGLPQSEVESVKDAGTLGSQTNLTIGEPHSELEQEAEYVSDQITHQSHNQGERVNKVLKSPREHSVSSGSTGVPSVVHQTLDSAGTPLPSPTRQTMEASFGHDFGGVRIHTNSLAARSAEAVNARAYTVGQNIVFGPSQYSPRTDSGRRLLAHELTHVVQQHTGDAQSRVSRRMIQRDFINDPAGNPTAYEFRIGTELEAAFVGIARRLARDGSIDDADLRRLRNQALQQRGTLDDQERMFMAGLLDPANVAILNGTAAGANFRFPFASLTQARMDHVIDLDRTMPQSVQDEMDDLVEAFADGDALGVLNEMAEVEAAAAQAIESGAGAFRAQARSLIAFINANNILASLTLTAMVNAASDNSRGDRILAGMVYAIASHANHTLTNRIANGDIKVDALVPSALAALPGFTGNEEAAYVTVAQAGGEKGDTMYVKTTLDPANTYHRSLVIHELRHSQDDEASSTAANVTFTAKNAVEANAYRAQARYIYDQLDAQAGATRTASAAQVAADMNGAVVVALVIEGQASAARNRPLFDLINQQVPAAQRLTVAQTNTIFGTAAATMQARLLTVINTLYGITNASQTPVDGLAGESILNWITRI